MCKVVIVPDVSTNRIGDYELLAAIGEGAEGRVYKARCIRPGASSELVALKRLRPTGQDKETLLFKRQTEILSKLDHPNIVRYKNSFIWREDELGEEVFCLVTELLEGQSVKALLESYPKGLPWAQASRIISEALSALQYASKQRVVHRDLKLSNFYITRQGTVKIIDFGIARDVGSSATTTASSNIKGSFDTMAPDFVRLGGHFHGDEQSDIFSLGVCFHQVLTGTLPFPPLGANPLIGYVSRWHSPTPPEPDFRHPVFNVLLHAAYCIRKCLAVDRKERYRTFDEVMADFRKIKPRTLRHGVEVYEYIEYLGKGGFGRVFHARRNRDGLEVAIKELLADRNASRFVREAKILQKARHPNLVQYLDFVEVEEQRLGDQRRLFLVLEYLKGMPGAALRERIRDTESGMDVRETLTIFTGYLGCLEHLHKLGIIHRDIKPSNLYAPAGDPASAKIFDLGVAHDIEGTRTHGQVPGTLDYMAPEFATQSNDRGSPQSDIYSLGVTLYQALTKKLPFPRLPEKESEAWLAFYQRSEHPQDCPFDHPVFKAHPELVHLIRRAIAPDPKQRYPSAAAMRTEVVRIVELLEKQVAFDAAMNAARDAFDQEDFQEAQKQAKRALELMPRDVAALALWNRAQDNLRHKAYAQAITATRSALAHSDYAEAERQAQKALTLSPGDREASLLLVCARQAAYNVKAKGVEDERPTAATSTHETFPDDATAPTLPTDLARAEREIQAAQVRDRAAREQRERLEAEKRRRVEQQKLEQVQREKVERMEHILHAAEEEIAEKNYPRAIELCDYVLGETLNNPHALGLKQIATLLQEAQAACEGRLWAKALRLLKQAQRDHPANKLVEHALSHAERECVADRARRTAWRQHLARQITKAVVAVLLVAGVALGLFYSWIYWERQYGNVLAEAQAALQTNNFTLAETAARRALKYKPWSTAVKNVLGKAQEELRYSAAMQAASNAWNKAQVAWQAATNTQAVRQYEEAVTAVSNALRQCQVAQTTKATEDATKLMTELTTFQELVQRATADAQTREKNYEEAMRAAKTAQQEANKALGQANYVEVLEAVSNALRQCQLARKFRQMPELGSLEEELKKLQAYAEAMQAATRAWDDATEALDRINSDGVPTLLEKALSQCAEALEHIPEDSTAGALTNRVIALQQALESFNQGKYEQANKLCSEHSAVKAFKILTKAIQTESNALATAQARFRSGDYALIDEVKQLTFGSKPPFAKLVTDAQAEADQLHRLEGIKRTNGWAVLQTNLAALAPEVRSKPPFKALEEWAKNEAQNFAEQLDATFVQLLDSFNVSVPDGLRPPGVQKARTLGAIGEAGKASAHTKVNALETAYKTNGLLEQNNRAAAIRDLRVAIDRWE